MLMSTWYEDLYWEGDKYFHVVVHCSIGLETHRKRLCEEQEQGGQGCLLTLWCGRHAAQ